MINENQRALLDKLLLNYTLKKDVNSLTSFEASIVIEGALNGGKVKNTYKDKKISEYDFNKKQKFFESLVEKKSNFATEKQINFILNLCEISKYRLKTKNVHKNDASSIINFLKNGSDSKTALKYLIEIETKPYDDLIKIKAYEKIKTPSFPKDWTMYNVEINGILNFKET